jgi:hypothetical protein
MGIPDEFAPRVAEFPEELRSLIEAELAAGNEIVELASCFPAPPAGAYVRLARPVSTRERKTGGNLVFYERNMPSYSGEFTDAERFFFVLEPPLPPPPEPDILPTAASSSAPVSREPQSAVERFRESMKIDYEKWHDGIGYDLDILKTATPEELVQIEELLVSGEVADWRDVQALATLNSPRAKALLRKTFEGANRRLAAAVMAYAPDVMSDEERTARLVAALEASSAHEGLTQTLLLVEGFHPPPVIEALFRGLLTRDGKTAVHFAAMLMFLHGKAESAFDWAHRPFFLKFNTEDRTRREELVGELRRRLTDRP